MPMRPEQAVGGVEGCMANDMVESLAARPELPYGTCGGCEWRAIGSRKRDNGKWFHIRGPIKATLSLLPLEGSDARP